jgi:myosin heavy subunit
MLAILDDVCNFPKGTDDKFLGKLAEAFSQHAHWAPAQSANRFIVKHYAGAKPCAIEAEFLSFYEGSQK